MSFRAPPVKPPIPAIVAPPIVRAVLTQSREALEAALATPGALAQWTTAHGPAQGNSEPVLTVAATKGWLEGVQVLLDAGAPVDARAKEAHDTAFLMAVRHGHVSIAAHLAERGADVQAWSGDARYRNSAWHILARSEAYHTPAHLSAMAELLTRLGVVQQPNAYGTTPLMRAMASDFDGSRARLLLAHNPGPINAVDGVGRTALHRLITRRWGEPAFMEAHGVALLAEMLWQGADVGMTDAKHQGAVAPTDPYLQQALERVADRWRAQLPAALQTKPRLRL